MYTIAKTFAFSAAHHLTGLPEGHPCATMHGHNYEVELELRAVKLDATGFVVDYRALDRVKQFIDSTFDHKLLNAVLPKMNPTAENLAELLFWIVRDEYGFGELSAVRVRETPKTVAEFRP